MIGLPAPTALPQYKRAAITSTSNLHCCWCERTRPTWQDVLDMLRFFLLVALLCAALAEHADVCSERTPDHDQSAVRAAGNGGYFVFTEALDGYEAGRDYRVVLAGFGEFQEFLLFAQNESGVVQGTWSPLNTSKSTTVNCSGVDNSAVLSRNEDSVSEQEFTWTAPAVNVGPVSFIYTVINNNSSYVDLDALENKPPLQVLAAIPEGCDPSDCDYYAAWTQGNNFDHVDFTLGGNVQGWVALGLSEDRVMGMAGIDDVLACQADAEGVVNIKDTFNLQMRRDNLIDDPHIEEHNLTTQGIFNEQTSSEEGHITCSFSRQKVLNNPSQDRDLVLPSFLFFGVDPDDTAAFNDPLTFHNFRVPIVSEQQVTFNLAQLAETPQLVPEADRVAIFPEPSEEQDPLGVFPIPPGCAGTSCNYMARWFRDGEDLLFELSANTNGWVAIGLSGDAMMSGAAFDDVIACQAEVGGAVVNAKDMHNPTGQRRNALDADQTGTQLISGGVIDGRLSCMVRRAINTSDTAQDYPLDQEGFVFFAYGSSQGDAQSILNYHGPGRQLTGPIILTVRTDSFPPPPPPHPLIRAHGILMLWSWLLLAASAIFYARYTRPAYVKGEWFEVHRAFLAASVVLTDIGFIVIFVGLSGFLNFGSSNPIGSAHFVIGCIVVGFQLYNPIIAAFRCHPGTKLRFIFDFIHGILVGTVVELLAFINCALGLWRFVEASQHRHDEQFYLYIVLLIVVVLFEVGMGIYHFIAKYIIPDLSKPPKDDTQSPSEDIELTEATNGKNPPQTEKKDKPAPKKRPSRDALFRRIMAILYSCVVILFLIILSVLVGVGVY